MPNSVPRSTILPCGEVIWKPLAEAGTWAVSLPRKRRALLPPSSSMLAGPCSTTRALAGLAGPRLQVQVGVQPAVAHEFMTGLGVGAEARFQALHSGLIQGAVEVIVEQVLQLVGRAHRSSSGWVFWASVRRMHSNR